MHDYSELARHQEQLAAAAVPYCDAAVDASLEAQRRAPAGSQFNDGDLPALRQKAQERLPDAPDRRGYVRALTEDLVAAGLLDNGTGLPESITALNKKMQARRDTEEAARLRKLLGF